MEKARLISLFASGLIDVWRASRALARCSIPGLLSVLLLVIFGSIPRGISAQQGHHRYRIEVLDHDIDPALFPEQYAADFDGDGSLDRLLKTDSSLHIVMSSGGRFDYTVSDMGENSATGVGDPVLLSFNRDGRFPSVIFPTEQDPLGKENGLIHQQVIYNDEGQLSLKTLAGYPLNGRAVDCAWIKSNDLPVCFYASFGPDMGQSKLIELNPDGLWGIAHDTDYLTFRNEISRYNVLNDKRETAKEQILALRDTKPETIELLLAEGWAVAATTFGDSVRALAYGLSDRNRIFCRDLTREYGLPWPVQLSLAYDQQKPEKGRWMDGYFMVDVTFLDFSGDGLLDMVAVGQHSSVFTAIQHVGGYFVEARYHGLPDEYHEVWGPDLPEDGEAAVPPCVLYSMEQDEAYGPDYVTSRSDYVECYDQISREWYEVELPQGPYWTEYERVVFQDFDGDGMVDLLIPRGDSTWVAFKFISDTVTHDQY